MTLFPLDLLDDEEDSETMETPWGTRNRARLERVFFSMCCIEATVGVPSEERVKQLMESAALTMPRAEKVFLATAVSSIKQRRREKASEKEEDDLEEVQRERIDRFIAACAKEEPRVGKVLWESSYEPDSIYIAIDGKAAETLVHLAFPDADTSFVSLAVGRDKFKVTALLDDSEDEGADVALFARRLIQYRHDAIDDRDYVIEQLKARIGELEAVDRELEPSRAALVEQLKSRISELEQQLGKPGG